MAVRYGLQESNAHEFANLPESGMGFQLVGRSFEGSGQLFLIMNTSDAYDISTLLPLLSEDPGQYPSNGLLISEEVRRASNGHSSLRLTKAYISSSRIAEMVGGVRRRTGVPTVVPPSALVKTVTLRKPRAFVRYSAYNPDRRVNARGDISPGSYAAPVSETGLVPSGFAAVGRFALPNVAPASYAYDFIAPAGTTVHFGTVAPAFGQAGGGGEAYFPAAISNVSTSYGGPRRLDDE